ncbi:hypothetical protein ALC152_03900 [Arcobacter sp. 15-2]|uniref:hypothetical protein n=1 Tax=Arcobacter sp. 15-2 TaxID=3374109 RepID=UPI00399D4247
MLSSILLKLGINLVVSYINSSNSDKDNEVLKVVQDGAKYLSNKQNNDVTVELADTIVKTVMK